jgi:ATP-dependent protease ClpP protease subunit
MMRCNKLLFAALLWFVNCGQADTFTNKKTGESFDGYATKIVRGEKVAVRSSKTEEIRYIEPPDYNVVYNAQGRRKQIYVIDINIPLLLGCETDAFEKALALAENQGNLAIVIKIDTPGGRVDLMKRYCTAVGSAGLTPIISIVGGGKNGGAYSAGAVIAMACDKIYMEKNSAIGAATLVVMDVNDGLKSAKNKYGQDIGEKFDSAHRAYCASVAEKAGRSGLIAQAMVDRQIEVLAVKTENGGFKFFDGREIKDGTQDKYILVNPKGSLLTFTAQRAVEFGFADGQIDSFNEWKQNGPYAGCKWIFCKDIQIAHQPYEQFHAAIRSIEKLEGKIVTAVSKNAQNEYKLKTEVLNAQLRTEVLTNIGQMLDQYRLILALKNKYADLPAELNDILSAINQLSALYNNLKQQ